ncbi:hypothetical protein C8F01DRAFT_1376476 [Mycena amicta]|nr:hypothetical protein C8F01DRAFT_1376476 [Mycena amicta]
MSVVSECPNELWLEILQHIPRHQLASISSTNRLLRQLTRPLLFACLQVRLHIPGPRPGFESMRWSGSGPKSILDSPASIDRMRFWMSPPIAPLVRSCVAGSRSPEYITCPTQVEFFLANLHTLTRLRSLALWDIFIHREGLAALHQLPCLEELSVDCCEVDAYPPYDDDESCDQEESCDNGESCDEYEHEQPRDEKTIPIPLLGLSKFSICSCSPFHDYLDPGQWILSVEAAQLRDLTLSCDSDYDFSDLGASNLRMVERLCVDQEPVRRVANLSPGTLPMLKDFEGPAQLARQLLACSPIERLTLQFDPDNALDEILSGAPPARNVSALHLSIFGVDIAFVDPVLKLFPNLTELTVGLDLYETTTNALHSLIWKTIRQIGGMGPTSLSSFSLELQVQVEREEYPDYDEEWSDCSDDFEVSSTADYTAFIAEVRKRCPGLKDLWIDIDSDSDSESPVEFAVQWRQLSDGQYSEEVARDKETIKRMRRMKASA